MFTHIPLDHFSDHSTPLSSLIIILAERDVLARVKFVGEPEPPRQSKHQVRYEARVLRSAIWF